MKIFYASEKSPNAFFDSEIWRINLLLPLRDLGHEVIEFDFDLKSTFQNLDPAASSSFIEGNREKVSAELLRQIKLAQAAKPIDLFFSYFTSSCITPATLSEIKAMKIKTMNWYCNASYQFNLVAEIAPHYDWCLVPEKFRMKDYEKIGAHPIYCQEAANPQFYKSYDLKKDLEVSFVGQMYGDRPEYIRYLVQNDIAISLMGKGWNQWANLSSILLRCSFLLRAKNPSQFIHGVISDSELVRVFNRSKINLGFSSCGDTHKSERLTQIRLRDFEVPMSGGFYLVEYMKELEEFFEIGSEIVCYDSKEDLLEKIHFYLKHDSEREEIARRGQERCLRDHSWQKRFEKVFLKAGLS